MAHVSPRIHVLPDTVSSRIAAGEVVERPAAVVKELVDNSLDAKSACITVEVGNGGKGFIRVVDDGEGMSKDEALLACKRFATSKIRSEEDLFTVKTLGFRGEALPSIASVSKLKLLTADVGAMLGTQIVIEGGTQHHVKEMPAVLGTQIEVAELFFNTPARQKFLKSTSTEFSHICHTIQQTALSWHDIHFRLIHNGHSVLDFPSVSSISDRIKQIYGDRFWKDLLSVQAERAGVRVEGYAVSPSHSLVGRVPQGIVVNRRFIKNSTISHAVTEAFGTFLPKGKNPGFLLLLEIDPTKVDVNVHPTKREIRFADSSFVHTIVKEAVRDALYQKPALEHETFFSRPSASLTSVGHAQETAQPDQWRHRDVQDRDDKATFSQDVTGNEAEQSSMTMESSIVSEPAQSYLLSPEQEIVPLGQVHNTFLVAQVGEELQVLDQHTAHERVLFERLWRSWRDRKITAQILLIPETLELLPHEVVLLEQYTEELATLGLELERFGYSSFLIRSVPAIIGKVNYALLIQSLLEDLAEWKSHFTLEERIRPVLASMACRGAVQAGRTLESREMKQLLIDWIQEGSLPTCPHGRRVALRFPAQELNRIFGRS